MRAMIAAFAVAALGLTGCVTVSPAPAPPVAAGPVPDRVTAATATANFRVAVARVEPVAERVCAQRTRGVNCDFLIRIDPNRNAPANAFQSLDRSGRPVLTFNPGAHRRHPQRRRDRLRRRPRIGPPHRGAHRPAAAVGRDRGDPRRARGDDRGRRPGRRGRADARRGLGGRAAVLEGARARGRRARHRHHPGGGATTRSAGRPISRAYPIPATASSARTRPTPTASPRCGASRRVG